MSTTIIIVISLIVIMGGYLYYNFQKVKNTPEVENNPKIKILTDKNFQHQIKTGVVLVDFWASWCMPCKMMAPVLNDVAEDLSGSKYVAKLDVEKHQLVAAQYKIRNIPTMILFKNGKEIDRYVGAKSKDFLINMINKTK